MSPEELKGYADIIVGFVSASGVSAIILAIIGGVKAKKEAAEKPTVGPAGMAAIGGALAAEGTIHTLTATLERVIRAHQDAQEDRHRSMLQEERLAEEIRASLRALGDDVRGALRRVSEDIDGVGDDVRTLARKVREGG